MPTPNRRQEAIDLTRQKSKESQQAVSGKSYLKWSGDVLEPKANTTSIISVIPYLVKEKYHPQRIPAGTLWYKRPFKVHRNMGIGDDARTLVCPKSFNPRNDCAPCRDVAEMVKDWDANEDAIRAIKASQRELMLLYNHDDSKIQLLNISYFLFGQLLDERIDNPPSQDCIGFWLDGDDGMALKVRWTSQKAGKFEFIKAAIIDFDQDRKYKVPAKVWKEAVELSSLLIETSSRTIEEIHHGCSTQDEQQMAGDVPFDTDREDGIIDLDRMGKQELLDFAKANSLFTPKDLRGLLRSDEGVIRAAVAAVWSGDDDVSQQSSDSLECPLGHKLGKKLNEFDECSECPDNIYDACTKAAT